jgi:hypothetical protein
MDAASSSQARGEERPGVAHGLIVAILREVHPDRIVVGERTLFLREGQDCRYPPGTNLEVPLHGEAGRAQRSGEDLGRAAQAVVRHQRRTSRVEVIRTHVQPVSLQTR